jgi:hypothetical protein
VRRRPIGGDAGGELASSAFCYAAGGSFSEWTSARSWASW